MQINPKIAFAVAIAMALIAMAAQGSVALPLGVPEIWGKYITSWSNFAVNVYVIAISPVLIRFGLNFTAPNAPIAAVVKGLALIAVLCVAAMHASPALADPDSMPIRPAPIQLHVTKPAPGAAPVLTGNPVADVKSALGIPPSVGPTGDVQSDLATIEKAISQDMLDDLTAAQAAYAALGDTAGGACNQEILSELTALKGAADAKGLPKVHLAFDFAIARTLVLAISPNGKLNNACAPVVQQTGQSVLQLVTGILSGSASILPLLGGA